MCDFLEVLASGVGLHFIGDYYIILVKYVIK